MLLSTKEERNLKFGNLLLAAIFSVVPTAMTITFLLIHGTILCRTIDYSTPAINKSDFLQSCQVSNVDVNKNYIVFIWLIILLPTWRWFYLGHLARVTKDKRSNK